MSSGTQNAQNFAAIISSMVLGPSFFDHFSTFSNIPIFWELGGSPPPQQQQGNEGLGGVNPKDPAAVPRGG